MTRTRYLALAALPFLLGGVAGCKQDQAPAPSPAPANGPGAATQAPELAHLDGENLYKEQPADNTTTSMTPVVHLSLPINLQAPMTLLCFAQSEAQSYNRDPSNDSFVIVDTIVDQDTANNPTNTVSSESVVMQPVENNISSSTNFVGVSSHTVLNLLAGSHTLAIRYHSSNGTTAEIQNSRIACLPVTPGPDVQTAAQALETPVYSTNTYGLDDLTDAKITFTPSTTQDFLLVASADVSEQSGTATIQVQQEASGRDQPTTHLSMVYTPPWMNSAPGPIWKSFNGFRKITLQGGTPVTFAIQLGTGGTRHSSFAYEAEVKDARLSLIPVPALIPAGGTVGYAEVEDSTANAHPGDLAQLVSGQYAGRAYLALGCSAISSDTANNEAVGELDMDQTNNIVSEQFYAPVDTGDRVSFLAFQRFDFESTSTSHRLETRIWSNGTDTASTQNSRALFLPLTGCGGRPDTTACNDGNPCTRTDTCQNGLCIGGNPVVCTAQDQCHQAGTCDPTSGTCSNPPQPDGTPCPDGNRCNGDEVCASGICNQGTPIVCNTPGSCQALPGSCHPPDGTCIYETFADGSLCEGGYSCFGGICDDSNVYALSLPGWTDVSPGPLPNQGLDNGASMTPSGRIVAIAVAPSSVDGNRVYAAGETSGLWRSDDRGRSWTRLYVSGLQSGHGLPVPEVLDIAVSPSDPNWVVVGTDLDRRHVQSKAGVYLSKDGGLTWAQRALNDNCYDRAVTQVQFSPDDPNLIFAAAGCKVLFSSVAGDEDNWTEASLPLQNVWHVAVGPMTSSGRRVWATADGRHVLQSSDGGNHFSEVVGPTVFFGSGFLDYGIRPNTSNANREAPASLAIDPSDVSSSTVFLAVSGGSNGPSYFHPASAGPAGIRCNRPIFIDQGTPGILDSDDLPIADGPVQQQDYGQPLADHPVSLRYWDQDGNHVFTFSNFSGPSISDDFLVWDANQNGKYDLGEFAWNLPDGFSIPDQTPLRDEDDIKPLGSDIFSAQPAFGERECGEGSLFKGVLAPGGAMTWEQLQSPPVYWGAGTVSGAVFVRIIDRGPSDPYLLFFSDGDTVHVSEGGPSESNRSWHRLDGDDVSVVASHHGNSCTQPAGVDGYNVNYIHADPHAIAFLPDTNLTLQGAPPTTDSSCLVNSVLGQWLGGGILIGNDGGLVWNTTGGTSVYDWHLGSGLSTFLTWMLAGTTSASGTPGLYLAGDDNWGLGTKDGAVWENVGVAQGDEYPFAADGDFPGRLLQLTRNNTEYEGVYVLKKASAEPVPLYPSDGTSVYSFGPPNMGGLGLEQMKDGARPVIQTLRTEPQPNELDIMSLGVDAPGLLRGIYRHDPLLDGYLSDWNADPVQLTVHGWDVALSTGTAFGPSKNWTYTTLQGQFPQGPFPGYIQVGDFNGDQYTDLLSYNGTGVGQNAWMVSLSTGSGFASPSAWLNNFDVESLTNANGLIDGQILVGNFDCNRGDDLAVWDNDLAGWRFAAASPTQNAFSVALASTLPNFGCSAPGCMLVGDFNGDGCSDLAAWNSGAGGAWDVAIAVPPDASHPGVRFSVSAADGLGAGVWVRGFGEPTAGRMLVGNFDGDNRADIAWFTAGGWSFAFSTPGTAPNPGAFVVSTSLSIPGFGTGVRGGTIVGDFDGDCYSDLASWVANSSGVPGGRWVVARNMVGSGGGFSQNQSDGGGAWFVDSDAPPLAGEGLPLPPQPPFGAPLVAYNEDLAMSFVGTFDDGPQPPPFPGTRGRCATSDLMAWRDRTRSLYAIQASGGHSSPVFYAAGTRSTHELWRRGSTGVWQLVVAADGSNGPPEVDGVWANPYSPSNIYVLAPNGIWRSDNAGATWSHDDAMTSTVTRQSSGAQIQLGDSSVYPNAAVNDIWFDAVTDGRIRVASGSGGVFYTVDDTSWIEAISTDDLPGEAAGAFLNGKPGPGGNRQLYIAYHGGGVFRYDNFPE